MGRVKELLQDKPFTEEESMFSLAKRLTVAVDCDLSYVKIPEGYERDLIRLRTALKEIIEHEDLSSKVSDNGIL
jgi:hypothetical protein